MACSQGSTAELLAKDWTQEESVRNWATQGPEGSTLQRAIIHSFAYSPDTGLVPRDCRWYRGMDLANPIYIVSNTQHHTGHFKLSLPFVKSVNWHVIDITPSHNPARRKNVQETKIGQVWVLSVPEGNPKDHLVLQERSTSLSRAGKTPSCYLIGHHNRKLPAACIYLPSALIRGPRFPRVELLDCWRLLTTSPLCDSG